MNFNDNNLTLRVDEHGVTWVGLDLANSAVNTLGQGMRRSLNMLLDYFSSNTPAKGVIFHSLKSQGFIMGADIAEFGQLGNAEAAKALVKDGDDLMDRLAQVPYPTLALVRGYALGGGCEFALACRYRVAVDSPQTKFGLPEVMLGIVPGWGGMRRLPEMIGPSEALPMMLAGKQVDAKKAKKLGLVDMCVPERVQFESALGYLLQGKPPRSLPFLPSLLLKWPFKNLIAAQAVKATAKKVSPAHYPAPFAIIEMFAKHHGRAIPPQGPADSSPHSLKALSEHPTTPNLLRVYGLQERLKSLAKTEGEKIRHVHVVGAGVMGGDIAAWCALRGLHVTLQDTSIERLAPAMTRAQELFQKRIKDDRLRRDAIDRLLPDANGHGIKKADLIIEAIFENLEAKQQLFKRLESEARSDAVLATNTSSIPLEQIATALCKPSRLVGIHFFNPVASMMLVEIVQGQHTDAEVSKRATRFVKQIDKLP
ncbi:MAG: hypothetical protein RLZZ502_1913, partial [Pseudomonadota bacterium]